MPRIATRPTRAWAGLLALPLCAGLLFGCGGQDVSSKQSTNEADGSRYELETRPVRWQISGRPRGETVRVWVDPGWCGGAPEPKIGHVEVTETDQRVSILVVVADVEEAAVEGDCAAIGLRLTRTVHLERPLGGREIVDASSNPPEPRWP